MNPALDIAIAGCGPGGLAAALLLHRQGHRVTIAERFDAPSPVGSGLLIQPTGLAVLDALGLGGAIRTNGAQIDELHGLSMPSGRRALHVDYRALGSGQCAYGVHRALLFETLFDATQTAGVPIRFDRQVTATRLESDGRRALMTEAGEIGRFDLVIDAMGARSPLPAPCGRALAYGALWATLDWTEIEDARPAMLDQRYAQARQMAGILPIGINPATGKGGAAYFWSLRADRYDDFRARGLDAWRAEASALWPQSAPLLARIEHIEQFTFARYAHRTVRAPVAPALVHLGDAWHSTSPQLGQGANMALLDAAALASALALDRPLSARLDHYAWLRRRHIQLYQAMSALFTPLYQSDTPGLAWLRDRLTDPFAGWWPMRPILAAMVAGHAGFPVRQLGLGSTNAAAPSTNDMAAIAGA